MTRGIHRVPADSKRGRQLKHRKGSIEAGFGNGLTLEQRAWNAKIETKRKQKKKVPA